MYGEEGRKEGGRERLNVYERESCRLKQRRLE